jgi:hypothetical protein
MQYLRAHVDPIRKHFDPIAAIMGDDIILAHGLAAIDLMRLKSHLAELNKCGLILVDRKDTIFRFLKFDKLVIGINTGFREAIESTGLSIGFDFELKDIAKKLDCDDLSTWVTLKHTEKLKAESTAKSTKALLENSRLPEVLGAEWIRIIQDLMWETAAFEPLHAIVIMLKASLKNEEISTIINNLRDISADLRYLSTSTRILYRQKSRTTLMDCANLLFGKDNYFEVEASEASKALDKPIDRLSSHFRGYLMVDEDYLEKLFNMRK